MCLAQQASRASYGSVYNIFTKYPLPNLMSTVLEEYHSELQLVLILVLLYCFLWFWYFVLKRKIFFASVFYFDFSFYRWFSKFIALDFSNGVFDCQNEINMDLTHVTASVVERFNMTSRRPYWCSKIMKRRPCWCTKKIPWEFIFSHVNDFFCSNKLA